jgi:hypothetical protein
MPLDKEAALSKFDELAAEISSDSGINASPESVATGFLTITVENMATISHFAASAARLASMPVRSLTFWASERSGSTRWPVCFPHTEWACPISALNSSNR